LGAGSLSWEDLILGHSEFDSVALGDFPLLRADGFWAYQLAVVVDDRSQGITHVIRGADLLDSTPRQIQVWQALSMAGVEVPLPAYGHLPLLTNGAGQKLSKQTLARPVEVESACACIDLVWGWLGQSRSEEWTEAVRSGDPQALLGVAAGLWSRGGVPEGPIQLQGWGQDERPDLSR